MSSETWKRSAGVVNGEAVKMGDEGSLRVEDDVKQVKGG